MKLTYFITAIYLIGMGTMVTAHNDLSYVLCKIVPILLGIIIIYDKLDLKD